MDYRPGDILGFSANTPLGLGIQLCTWGRLTHVAVVASHRLNGTAIIYESTSQSDIPCIRCGKTTAGVHARDIGDVIDAFPGRVWHYPLRSPLDAADSARLLFWLAKRDGRPYDYLEAVRARKMGGWLTRLCNCTRDDSEYQCAELVAGALEPVNRFANGGVWNPSSFCRAGIQQRQLLRPRRVK